MSRPEKPTKPEAPATPPLSSEDAMRESLEELAQNVDVLVDRLTMDMTDTPLGNAAKPEEGATTPAPAEDPEEVAALAEGMIDSLTVSEPEAIPKPGAAAETKPAAKTRSRVKAGTTPKSKPRSSSKAKVKTQAKPEAETGSTESLSQASSPEQYSEMIDAELDKLFGKYESGDSKPKTEKASARPKTAKAKAARPKAAKIETPAPPPAKKHPAPAKTAEVRARPAAAPPAAPKAKPAPTPAATAPTVAPPEAPARESVIPWSDVRKPTRRSGGRMWMVAAGVLVVGAIAVGLWFMFSPGDPSSGAGPIAGVTGPGQERRAATKQSGSSNLATPFDVGQWDRTAEPSEPEPADEPPVDAPEAPATDDVPETTTDPVTVTTRPSAAEPEPAGTVSKSPPSPKPETPVRPAAKPAPAKTDPVPPARSAGTPPPVEKPEPKPARVTAPAPPPAKPKPEPKPEPEPEPPAQPEPKPAAAVEPVKEPEPDKTTKPPAEPSEKPRPAIDRSIPVERPAIAAASSPTPPDEAVAKPSVGTVGPDAASMASAGEITPPELVSRHEPQLTQRERKRAKSGVVVLRVLVSDRGRVVRVIIEDPMQGSAFEARAIDSALRSVYRPAMQDGEPVEAWVTERFAFVP